MREGVVIGGVGMTRFGKAPDRTVRDLAQEAVATALADARLAPSDVGVTFMANAVEGFTTGQEMIRGQVALRFSGLLGIPIVNVENACASGATAVAMARMAVLAGEADVALAVGVEKLVHADRGVSFAAINSAVDVGEFGPPPRDRSLYMEDYAAQAQAYIAQTDATVEDLARVSAKNHAHGALNPLAQYGVQMSVEQVLGSRTVADPLTVLMCSPLSDGAAAVVVMSQQYAAAHDIEAVRIAGSAIRTGRDRSDRATATEAACQAALAQAEIGASDLDVVEVHDAAASAELKIYEQIGLCAQGEAAKLLRSGGTALGGRVPVNPSGGLLSKGHPIAASGCAQIVELVEQLRGRCDKRQVAGARYALAQNAGGWLGEDTAVAVATVLAGADTR